MAPHILGFNADALHCSYPLQDPDRNTRSEFSVQYNLHEVETEKANAILVICDPSDYHETL